MAIEVPEINVQVPEEVKEAIRVHGFHKVAGALYGVDFDNERALYEYIGTKLAMQLIQDTAIKTGLAALEGLKETK
jgi:hypothetical protein